MIRLIQRRLIIPRGDTGTFTVPVLATKNTGDVAVFSIIDTMTDKKVFEKIVNVSGDTMTIEFSHYDTVNLPVGKYVWDIKFYQNPEFMDGVLVNGVEVDSYYAAFTMPICEIRQTGDNLLMADDAPGTELTPDQLDILNAAVNETNAAKSQANESAASANIAATTAANKADEATAKAEEATAKAEEATVALNELKEILPTLAEVATSGSYEDLEDKPFIPSRVSDLTDDSGHYTKPANGIPASDLEETYLTEHQDISGKANVADLAAVATSGSYTDLDDKPYIPVKTSDLTNDSNYAIDANYVHTDNNYTTAEKNKLNGIAAGAEVNVNADWNATSGDAQILNKPTKVSDFTNDAGYLTTETDPTVPAWAKAAQKPTYTASEVGAPTVAEMNTAIGTAIGNINSFDMAVVQALPTQDISTHTIYLVPKTGDTNDVYDEYVYINNAWEMVGNTQVDLSNYVQFDDVATADRAGVVKVDPSSGFGIAITKDGVIGIVPASNNEIKLSTGYNSIPPSRQHASAFYGLAKAAGDTTQSKSANAVGAYTDEAKAAIRNMIGVPALEDIPEAPVQDVQIDGTSIVNEGVANIPLATNETVGLVKPWVSGGLAMAANNDGRMYISGANPTRIKGGAESYRPIVPYNQHESTFYGLAKAAGADEKDSTLPVGQYTDAAKTAIRNMIGATSENVVVVQDEEPTDPDTKIWIPETATSSVQVPTVSEMETALAGKVGDVQIDGTSIVSDGVAEIPIGGNHILGVVKTNPNRGTAISASFDNDLCIAAATTGQIQFGNDIFRPIVPARQHYSVFYGLSKAATSSDVGTYTDSEKTAIKAMLGVEEGLKVVRLI